LTLPPSQRLQHLWPIADQIDLAKTKQKESGEAAPSSWQERLPLVYPESFSLPFASYHTDLWQWFDDLGVEMPPSLIVVWPRGGGKSTAAEVATIEGGATKTRMYCWYVRETQDQADKSVENIGALLESLEVERYYPLMSERALGKFGKQRGWRRNRLSTAQGFTVDAMGLDKAVRGVKEKERRPDLLIFDDIDGRHDTIATTTKKIEIITQSIIPAGSTNVAVVVIQNLLLPDGVVAQLVDGRAEFLLDRVVSGPHTAVKNLIYEQKDGKFVVTGGEPTWPEGQGIETIEKQINLWGLTSFLREAQHEVEKSGGMYDHIEFQHCKRDEVPDLVRVAVWVDPAVTSTDQSDSMGIQADGIAEDGTIYRLFSWEAITSPEDAIKRAIRKALELGSIQVGIETDQGGDTWLSVYARALESMQEDMKPVKNEGENDEDFDKRLDEWANMAWPTFKADKAGAGHGPKTHRGQQMLADYENGTIVHVTGTHAILEKSLYRFPKKPLDLADAAYWSWADLRNRLSARSLIDWV